MTQYLRIAGTATAFFAGVAVLFYLLLLGASHAYVSGGLAAQSFDSPAWGFYGGLSEYNIPGLTDYGPIVVKEVNALHAVRNIIFIMSTAGLATLAPLFFIVGGIGLAFYGLFTGNWEEFLTGLLGSVLGTLLSVLLLVLFIVVSWVTLLFQPSTPAYTVIWLLGCIPFTAIGGAGGASPAIVILIYK